MLVYNDDPVKFETSEGYKYIDTSEQLNLYHLLMHFPRYLKIQAMMVWEMPKYFYYFEVTDAWSWAHRSYDIPQYLALVYTTSNHPEQGYG